MLKNLAKLFYLAVREILLSYFVMKLNQGPWILIY